MIVIYWIVYWYVSQFWTISWEFFVCVSLRAEVQVTALEGQKRHTESNSKIWGHNHVTWT